MLSLPSFCASPIRQCQFPDGERVPMLLDGMGIPDLVVSAYITAVVRPTGVSYSRMKQRVRGIERGRRMVFELGIDLDERVATGTFLTREELAALQGQCLARDGGGKPIGSAIAGTYYGAFIDYVLWLAEAPRQRADRDARRILLDAAARFEQTAARYRPPPDQGATNQGERHGLTPAQRQLFLEVITPGHPGNPFTRKLQIRNRAIMLLAYFLGPRSGETHSLKREDYEGRELERTITFRRRPFDPDDTRREPVLVKTLGRTIALADEIADALDDWLRQKNLRKGPLSFPRASNPFIFISTRGEPLSLRAARNLFTTLGRCHPELQGVCQHVLRHDDSERWVEEHGTTEESEIDHRYKKGWTADSTMPAKYARRAIAKRTGGKVKAHAEKALKGLARRGDGDRKAP